MGAIVKASGIKYVPKQARTTLPVTYDQNGNPLVVVVDRENFTQDHADLIINFWKELAKNDKVFNFDKAMTSTFDIAPADEEELVLDNETDVTKMTVADLKKFAADNQIDISDVTVKADILDKIVAWQEEQK